MPRKNKGIHTSPETAGRHNMPKGYEKRKNRRDEDNIMGKIMGVWDKSFENRENYKGKWTEETMREQIHAFFLYCDEVDLKPSKVALALWLATTKQQIWEWENKDKGFKGELIGWAIQAIEIGYINSVEKYPTGNIFLLKSSHGHAETQNINFVGGDSDDVKENIKRLGLDES